MTKVSEKLNNIEDAYPLTALQRGMLFHSIASPQSGVYIEQITATISNTNFSIPLFQQCWNKLISRHTALRSVFAWEDLPEPIQLVRKEVELSWHIEDYRLLDDDTAKQNIDRFQIQDKYLDFDLTRAPLMRMGLIRISEDKTLWIWTRHHILADGWSTSVLLQELKDIYSQLSQSHNQGHNQSHAIELNAAPLFRDYIAHRIKAAENIKQDHQFWQNYLGDVTNKTSLSLGQSRHTQHQLGQYKQKSLKLSTDVSNQLIIFSQQSRVTLNVVMQAAWAILLSRYATKENTDDITDIVWGATFSGRLADVKDIEKTVGLCINTLPLRLHIDPEKTISTLLTELQSGFLEVMSHEHNGLEDIQKWTSIPAGENLFDSLVVFENYPKHTSQNPSRTSNSSPLQISKLTYHEQSNLPLALIIIPGKEIELILIFDSTLYSEASIERMLCQLKTCLSGFPNHQHTPIGHLPFVSENEINKFLKEWNNTEFDYKENRFIDEIIDDQAHHNPQGIAVSFNDETITYAQLKCYSDQWAGTLLRQSLLCKNHNPIAICLPRSINLVIWILAVLKSGNSYLILDPNYPENRLKQMLKLSGAEALISAQSNHLNVDSPIIFIDGNSQEKPPQVQEEITSSLKSLSRSIHDTAYVLFTSGSTGNPKGVMVSHANLRHSTLARQQYYTLQPDVFLLMSSFSFDSSVVGLYWTLVHGGHLVVSKPRLEQDLNQLVETINQHQVTHLLCLPSILSLLAEHIYDTHGQTQVNSLQVIISAGEAIESTILIQSFKHAFPSSKLFNEYGPTEATVWCSVYDATNHNLDHPVPIGKPIANTQLFILDNNHQYCPLGVPGELVISGSGITKGYLNNDEQTDYLFQQHNHLFDDQRICYHTGDLARYREDGEIEFLGRIDQQIKVRGYRVAPHEITNILTTQFNISDAAVIGVSDNQSKIKLVAIIAGQTLLDSNQILHKLSNILPGYMIPQKIVQLTSSPVLPTLPNGKLDYSELTKIAQTSADVIPSHIDDDEPSIDKSNRDQPQNETQKCLMDIWQKALNLPQIGMHDNFFELGGDSILSIKIMSKASQAGYKIAANDIFEKPTLYQLSQQIEPLTNNELNVIEQSEAYANQLHSFPLTHNQTGFLFAHLQNLENNSAADPGHIQIHALIEGKVDLKVFQNSWLHIINNNEMLRASIQWKDVDIPQQKINQINNIDILFKDIQNQNIQEQLAEYLSSDRKQSIPLEYAPCWRLCLFKLTQNQHLLIWSCHHIFIDGWSAALTLQQVIQHYHSQEQSKQEQSSQVQNKILQSQKSLSYSQYVNWLDQQTNGENIQWHKSYWIDLYANKRKTLDHALSINRGTHPLQSVFLEFKGEIHNSIQRKLAKESTTIAQLFQSAWALCLAQISAFNQIEFFTTLSGRNLPFPEIDTMIGQFVNHLPLLIDIDKHTTIDQAVEKIKLKSAEIRNQEHISIAQIQKWFHHNSGTFISNTDGNFVVPSLLMVENFPWDTITKSRGSDQIQLNSFQRQGDNSYFSDSEMVSGFPLTLVVTPDPTSIAVKLYFDSGLFNLENIQGWFNQIDQLIQNWSVDQNTSLSSDKNTTNFPVSLINSNQLNKGNVKHPQTTLEKQLHAIWLAVLKMKTISIDQNFFELGGSSMLAVTMMEMIHKQLNIQSPLSILIQNNTIEKLARALHTEGDVRFNTLVEIQGGSKQTAIFGIHAEGNVLFYRDLAECLGHDQAFYGLQSRELSGDQIPFSSIKDMAAHYIEEIKSVQPEGPYIICGMCFGGWIAFEMAQQLIQSGDQVKQLIIFDSGGPRMSKKYYAKIQHWIWRQSKIIQTIHAISRMHLKGVQRQIKKAAQHSRLLKKNYIAERYSNDILFIRSEEFENNKKLKRHLDYWQALCEQEVHYHLVPGEHGNVLEMPQVRETAKILKNIL